MVPALWPGDRIVVWRPPARLWKPKRGDIVLVRWNAGMPAMIKRVVGTPGERIVIESGRVSIDGVVLLEPYLPAPYTPRRTFSEWDLENDEYFLLGDNRVRSADSRRFGPVRCDSILGRAWYRTAPETRAGWLVHV
jgi:signal peptidase I